MIAYQEITRELSSLARWQAGLFATGCVHRAGPVVDAWAEPETAELFRAGLSGLWSGKGEIDVVYANDLREQLEQLPEAEEDDSHYPSHSVMRVLALLDYALDVASADGALEARDLVCGDALSFYSGVGFVLTHERGATVTVHPADRSEPNAHTQGEAGTQRLTLELVRGGSANVTQQVHQLSQQRADELRKALPEYAHRRGWSI